MTLRYEAIELDGRWYVLDHRYPADRPAGPFSEDMAKINARVWNLFAAPMKG